MKLPPDPASPAGRPGPARLQRRRVRRERRGTTAPHPGRVPAAARASSAAGASTTPSSSSARRGSRRTGPWARYYAEARELARLVTEWSEGLKSPAHRYLVCTGGGPGIMEAANRGAREAGGRTIGLNIGLPHEQRPNPYITAGLSFEFRYFFMRKLWFAYVARAHRRVPRRLRHAGRAVRVPDPVADRQDRPAGRHLLYGTGYWNEIVDFDALVRHGMVDADDLKLLHFVDTPAEAMEVLRRSPAAGPRRGRRPRSRGRSPARTRLRARRGALGSRQPPPFRRSGGTLAIP